MRALKVLVVVMGVLIVLGTVTLVWVVVQRVSGAGGAGAPWSLALERDPGARIAGIAAAEGGAVALLLTGGAGGDRVLVVDPRRGRILGEIRAAP